MAEIASTVSAQAGGMLPSRDDIARLYLADEAKLVRSLAQEARLTQEERGRAEDLARRLVHAARAGRRKFGGVDRFMQEYSLSSQEGIMLMCLAEALLRVPDAETADRLIADKIALGEWEKHLGHSDSAFVNASTWGLMLTGRFVEMAALRPRDLRERFASLLGRSGEPVIRQAMRHAMRIMGEQFVLGRTIEEALKRARNEEERGYRFSYDMLGEGALTAKDAQRYYESYARALQAVARAAGSTSDPDAVFSRPSLSVKLSALHPRYEPAQRERVMEELLPRVRELARAARAANVALTIDAEEQERLDLSLALFGRLLHDPELKGWDGLGLAVQAYGRRALPTLRWLAGLARDTEHVIPVRLVKGAYWDTEIKRAQEQGLDSYPVFTRKTSTDVSYLACARLLLASRDRFYPQFATHNAQTVAAVRVMAGNDLRFEYQRLHGMGQGLYEEVVPADKMGLPCRIYAPVGSHEDLLAYLVRRLLENGANTSFVNRLASDEAPVAEIIADPVETVASLDSIPHPRIPSPQAIYGAERPNSRGVLLTEDRVRLPLAEEMKATLAEPIAATPLVVGLATRGEPVPVTAPQDRRVRVGTVVEADAQAVDRALSLALAAQPEWDRLGGAARGAILRRAADLYEENRALLMALCVREAGKTVPNAQADLREAVDFLRYYAAQAEREFAGPMAMPGPTGERNELSLHGRGVFACISPWNFPVAIFTGQVAAALAAGNAVAAKPAEQTPLVAYEAVRLMHQAGVPEEVLSFLPGRGETVGARLVGDPRIAGIAFTGSNATAAMIQRTLAERGGPIIPFIAETGGINAMIVDSSALPEQAVRDAVRSAFDSAGQRCSALRLLFVQRDVADRLLPMLVGASEELSIGDPFDFATDLGPVIDGDAREALEAHKAAMRREARVLLDRELPEAARHGTFVAPAIYELQRADQLQRETFGPILHVVRYAADRLGAVCDAINAMRYGLTLGVHTRIETTADFVADRVKIGNLYVNRNQIGAVVGTQPFGGEGLSGTGPKAGGPFYLHRFATERVRATDTTASGGNASLLSLGS
jgi:RHH-type proline utilization regulon transcriptional repressor/proline dehydrogenase/delta 1-pyrroline-5-carboxylate dehydrogenase